MAALRRLIERAADIGRTLGLASGMWVVSFGGVAAMAATVVLPTENEWYKAAYYSPGGTYFDYPTGTDVETTCVAPAADTGNSANCGRSSTFRGFTDVGAYGLSVSPYGTFDQGGNVWEWNEQIAPADIGGGLGRGVRGGGVGPLGGASGLTASTTAAFDPTIEIVGFRVASPVPQPGQVLLVLTGGIVLAAAPRKRRA